MVVPAVREFTKPVLLTVATAELLLLHASPGVALVNVVELPRQTEVGPEMGVMVGNALIACVLLVLLVQPLALGGVV